MPSAYTSLHYHIVFSTKDRVPTIVNANPAVPVGDQRYKKPRLAGGVFVETILFPARIYSTFSRNSSFACSTTCAVLKPNFFASSFNGADAPNVFMPMMIPSDPT